MTSSGSMPRVLHVVASLDRTSPALQLLALVPGLRNAGVACQVAALDARGALAEDFRAALGAEVVNLERRWRWDPIVLARLRRAARRAEAEVVHAWDAESARFALSSRLAHARIVVGIHEVERWKSAWQWHLDRRASVRVHRFVTSSRLLQNLWTRHGLPAEKFEVIPPAAPKAVASTMDRNALLAELALPPDARLIGAVGPLVPDRRVKDLIWAADLLRVLHDNLRLLVIGDGPLRSYLEEYASLASDLEHVRFLGARRDVAQILPHLDVLWNGSDSHGHSLEILEAMGAGVPVVASDTAFHRELVVEGETGYLIPLGSRAGRAARARHTDRIFGDAELSRRLADAARCRCEKYFSAENVVPRYLKLVASA